MGNDCIFCKIVKHEIPAGIRYEDEDFVAFDDINPKAKIHILVIPKRHISSINNLKTDDADLVGRLIIKAKDIAGETGISESGYRLAINTGPDAGQVVFHIHLHILGGKPLGPMA